MGRTLIIADAHLHSNPLHGMGAKAISEKFRESGGWFMALVMLPTWSYGDLARNLEAYMKALDIHLRECRSARENGLEVSCLAGFHPAEIDKLLNTGASPYSLLGYAQEVIDVLFRMCDEHVINGIGEVGRQHYKSRPESIIIAQELLDYIFDLNRDYSCPLQLHTENLSGFTARNIRDHVVKNSCNKSLVLLHHAGPSVVSDAIQYGLWSTTPGIKENLAYLLRNIDRYDFMVETDYTDDPWHRGVAPWELRDVYTGLLSEGILDEDLFWKLNVENVASFFDVEGGF